VVNLVLRCNQKQTYIKEETKTDTVSRESKICDDSRNGTRKTVEEELAWLRVWWKRWREVTGREKCQKRLWPSPEC